MSQQQQIAGSPASPDEYSGGILKEFKVVLPITVEEYQVAQLYSVAEASKNETGGGEGIEVRKNEPFTATVNAPKRPLLGGKFTEGQYTYKIYHLQSKVPGFIRMLAPKGSLEIHEEAWNAYPYCRTVITNPDYMKDNFFIVIESFHLEDRGDKENPHQLSPDDLKRRESVLIDIANDKVSASDYKESTDPKKFKSEKTGRGPLDEQNWHLKADPIMCAYKLVRTKFKWFGLQNRVQHFIMKQEQRIFTNFHREVFCWMDRWHGLTMADIRAIEDKTKEELDESRKKGNVRGTSAAGEKE